MRIRGDVHGPTAPDLCDSKLGTVFIPRRRQLRALTDSAEQHTEGSGLWFGVAHLVTGAQDCHGWAFEIGSKGPVVEIEEGDEEEPISSRKGLLAALYTSGSMRSLLDVGGGRARESKTGPPIYKVPKSVQIWCLERAGFRN
jgi:hypothetical protein